MKQIKASIFLKITFFILNFVFLFNFLIIQNFFSLQNFLMFFLVFINFVTFFFVLKWNKKFLKISFFLPILIMIFYFLWFFKAFEIYIFLLLEKSFSFIIVFIFLLFLAISLLYYFIWLFLFYKKLNKENLEEKYFTYEKQEKNYLILFFITVFLLFVFRFWYYERTEEYDIPKGFFITKLENEKFESDENIYIWLKNIFEKYKESENINFKTNILYCLYDDKCYFEKEEYINWVNEFLWKYETSEERIKIYENILEKYLKEKSQKNDNYKNLTKDEKKEYSLTQIRIKELQKKIFSLKTPLEKFSYLRYKFFKNYKNLSEKNKIFVKTFLRKNFENIFKDNKNFEKLDEILKFSEKKYFKTDILGNEEFGLRQKFYRNLNLYFAYLLENKREKEFLEKFEKLVLFQEKIFSWDSNLVEFLIVSSGFRENLEFLEIILKNFELNLETKEKIKELLGNKIFSKEKKIFENIVKIEYLKWIKWFDLEIENFLRDYSLYNENQLNLGTLLDIKDFKRIFKEIAYETIIYDWSVTKEVFVNPFKKNILWRNTYEYKALWQGFLKNFWELNDLRIEILRKLKEQI